VPPFQAGKSAVSRYKMKPRPERKVSTADPLRLREPLWPHTLIKSAGGVQLQSVVDEDPLAEAALLLFMSTESSSNSASISRIHVRLARPGSLSRAVDSAVASLGVPLYPARRPFNKEYNQDNCAGCTHKGSRKRRLQQSCLAPDAGAVSSRA
jgi:hypothetical protein